MRFCITRKRILFGVVLTICFLLIGVEVYFLSASTRKIAVGAAETLGADDYLVSLLSDHDLEVRSAARAALIRRGAGAVPALVRGLNEASPGNRSSAAATLAHMGPVAGDSIPALRQRAIEDPDESVLESAGAALGRVARHHPETVLELLAMLESSDDSKRLAAIRAVAGLDDGRAVPLLIPLLKNPNPKIREEAAEALGELEEKAIPALTPLIELLDDPWPSVRGEARQAIKKLLKAKPESMDLQMKESAEKALEKAGFKPGLRQPSTSRGK